MNFFSPFPQYHDVEEEIRDTKSRFPQDLI